SATVFWRMPCQRTGIGRLDPLMDPGEIADHVHTIHGGGNFGLNTTYEDLAHPPAGPQNCTSCQVIQDKSAYWTPALYFMRPNGTTELVHQVGGMLAYYEKTFSDAVPFPEGFRMLAGNRNVRNFSGPFPDTDQSTWPWDASDQFFLEQRALGFNCLHYATAPEPSLYRHEMPNKTFMDTTCTNGLRLELAFPTCGNGSLDSSDHQSHMRYPSVINGGNCPTGFDVHFPYLHYETIWNTQDFAYEDGEFVFSNGDPVGTGYHGDFIMGWESSGYLGQAMQECTNSSGQVQDCPLFTTRGDEANFCNFTVPEVLVHDNSLALGTGLPGGVPIQSGPAPAAAYPDAGHGSPRTSSIPSASAAT
ncbi:hypothetical protein BAUCODRAFT_46702, partial [Baudoinia panamericana UAMH 10762]